VEPERWKRIQELFDAAIELAPDRRAPYLNEACPDDPELRREVESLIESAGRADGFVERALHGAAEGASPHASGSMTGRTLGVWKLLSEIGRGGMGAVYLSRRDDHQYHALAAVKIIREEFETPELRARFLSERQILASLDHPNIARLIDGGTTEQGVPYVVMECVEGVPIDEYCAVHGLSIEDRLELFLGVCAAVEYAHQNLVVHRDLKPGNILVTPEGVPKLLDFGIAKLLDPARTPHTVAATRTDARVLTPEYASPEQIRGERVTTASDVYALGVLLYEILTGRRPFKLGDRRPSEWERVICEDEPTRPSVAVTEPVDAARLPARMEPRTLSRRLAGDLDNIVQMAMRKEPARRYGSVGQMAADIRRHLQGLTVAARPDTWHYRVGKFVRRHRLPVAAAGTVVALLIVLAVAMTVQARRIAVERDTAELERANAQEVSRFLVELFSVSDPSEARGNEILAREILDKGAERIRTELTAQPQLQGSLMETMGDVYRGLGLYEEAESLLREALETLEANGSAESAAYAEAELALVLHDLGRYDEAELHYRGSVENLRDIHGGDHEEVATAINNLGMFLQARGDYAAAEPLLLESLAMMRRLGDDDDVATQLNNIGMFEQATGDPEGAEPYLQEALAVRRGMLPDPHPFLALSLVNLAGVFDELGRFEDAERLEREALAMRRRLYGDEHDDVAGSLNNLAGLLEKKGDLAGAEDMYRESLATHRRLLGEEHPSVATVMNNLAAVIRSRGRLDEAEPLYREALEMRRKLLGSDHVSVAISLNSLGRLALDQRDFATAESLYDEVHRILVEQFDEGHPYVAMTLSNLGVVRHEQGRHEEAERDFREALRLGIEYRGEDHPDLILIHTRLAAVLVDRGRTSEAEELLRRALEIARDAEPSGSLTTAHPLIGLGAVLVERDPAAAEPLLREGLSIREAALPEGHPETVAARAELGRCLTALGRREEAESVLRDGLAASSESAE